MTAEQALRAQRSPHVQGDNSSSGVIGDGKSYLDARIRARDVVARITGERGVGGSWNGLEALLALVIRSCRHGHRPRADFHSLYLGLAEHEKARFARVEWVLHATGLEVAQWSGPVYAGGPKREDWVRSIVNPTEFTLDRHDREEIFRAVDSVLRAIITRDGETLRFGTLAHELRGRSLTFEERLRIADRLSEEERNEVHQALARRTAELKNMDLVARAEQAVRLSVADLSLTSRELMERFGGIIELSPAVTYLDQDGRPWHHVRSEHHPVRGKLFILASGPHDFRARGFRPIKP